MTKEKLLKKETIYQIIHTKNGKETVYEFDKEKDMRDAAKSYEALNKEYEINQELRKIKKKTILLNK